MSETQAPTGSEATSKGAGRRLRRRLPDLILEAAMIFFALLLALAAEEWRERQDRLELAERALQAVVAEIEANRDELERSGMSNLERVETARALIARLDAGEQLDGVDIGWDIALLSTAAWQSAQMSQAVQYMDFETMRRVSEVYEVQALFERMQMGLVDRISDLMRVAREDPRAAVEQGFTGGSMLLNLQQSVVESYGQALVELQSP